MKWKSFLLTCFAMFFIVSSAQAATPISVLINDRPVKTDVAPFIKDGTTFVPLRTIEQIEGLSIKSWNNKTKTLVIVDSTKLMTFSVKQNQSESMLIKNNRVMVPIRFIAENFNSDVAWNANTRTVQVVKLNAKTKANLNSDDLTKIPYCCNYYSENYYVKRTYWRSKQRRIFQITLSRRRVKSFLYY